MADLAIVPGGVAFVDGPIEKDCTAGAIFAAGDMVALDSDGTWKGARCNSTVDLAGANKYGMALASAAAIGQRVSVALDGAQVTIGAFPTAGVVYYVSATPGKLDNVMPATSTNKITPCALGISSTRVKILRVYDAGSVKP